MNLFSIPPVLHVLSGAGLSAASGIPTFRDAQGLWEQHDLNKVCNIHTWKNHRSDVFSFYRARREQMSACRPNAAHQMLARWQSQWGAERVRLYTQNVDNLLEQAGAQEVVHLHGNLTHLQCTACANEWEVDAEQYRDQTRCPKCDSLKGVKPAVVFFGERAPQYLHLRRLNKRIGSDDWLVVVGTSLQVIAPEQFIPLRRKGVERNCLVDPDPQETDWFGRVARTSAAEGLAELEPFLLTSMGHSA